MSALHTFRKLYFLHCTLFFAWHSPSMSFSDQLADYTAVEIIEVLGCPRATAYQWKDGTRQPPEWQHAHWLAIIEKGVARIRRKRK